jgi:multiple antibiotic resistance protein
MISAAQQNSGFIGHLSLIIPILAISIIIWIILRLSLRISRKLGTIGINIVTRLMGLILAAMAVEFIAHGLVGLFPQLANQV